MKENLTRTLARYQRTFASFTSGQKMVAILGTAALLLAGFMVFRWASTPSYAPLFTNLASEDASAVVEQLDAEGIPYEIAGNGGTIMVPRSQVHETRIALSGEGLPGDTGSGYSLLDDQDISTSQFQEQTDFKRAMEGELSTTIEAIDDVETAVVHLALPAKQIFADEQDPPTASVLVDTRAGATLEPQQVQAVVHLVASSIDGLDPDQVTVADSTGRVLSVTDGTDGAGVTSRNQQVGEFQDELNSQIQAMLDRVVGPGNSSVQVTANLDFDKAVTESTTYAVDEQLPPLSSSTSSETYSGPAGGLSGAGAGGVVGPDGQMEAGSGGDGSTYEKSSTTADNAVGSTVETRETAPGSVESLHTAVVLDAEAARNLDAGEIEGLVAAAIGIDPERGDTVRVSTMPFDRSVEEAAAAELKAAQAADADARRMELYRNGGIAFLVALLVIIVWFRGRGRNKARANATTMVVEQLRQDQAARAAALMTTPAMTALERSEHQAQDELRDELAALVERQPEDVAMLLRGWLVERH